MDNSTSQGDLLRMLNFNAAVNLYKNDKIQDLAETDDGMRFLKLRSLSRKKYLDYLGIKATILSKGLSLITKVGQFAIEMWRSNYGS